MTIKYFKFWKVSVVENTTDKSKPGSEAPQTNVYVIVIAILAAVIAIAFVGAIIYKCKSRRQTSRGSSKTGSCYCKLDYSKTC